MRLLLLPCPDTTSLNIIIRCVSIAAEAIRQGHAVAVAAPSSLMKRFSRLDLSLFDYPEVPHIERVHLELPPIKKFGDYAELIGLNDAGFIDDSLAAEARIIERFEPAVVYSDICLTAPVSVRDHDLPLASLCNLAWTPPQLLEEGFEDDEAQTAPFNRLLALRGREPIRDLSELIYLRSDLKLVPSCPEFEQFPPSVGRVEYIGYLYSDVLEDPEAEADLPEGGVNLLVYMGIGDIDLELMERVLPRAFDSTPYRVTVVLGDVYPELPAASENVRWLRFLPLRKALERTALVIFHGGSGLVMTCLLYGVPGLMFPCGVYEREHHAETMAQVGAGEVLYEIEQFNPEELRRQVEKILGGGYRRNAETFGAYLRSLGGPARAVELLTGLAAAKGGA